jgi:hypothetical protein
VAKEVDGVLLELEFLVEVGLAPLLGVEIGV